MPGPGYTSPKSKRGKALGLKKPKFTYRSNTSRPVALPKPKARPKPKAKPKKAKSRPLGTGMRSVRQELNAPKYEGLRRQSQRTDLKRTADQALRLATAKPLPKRYKYVAAPKPKPFRVSPRRVGTDVPKRFATKPSKAVRRDRAKLRRQDERDFGKVMLAAYGKGSTKEGVKARQRMVDRGTLAGETSAAQAERFKRIMNSRPKREYAGDKLITKGAKATSKALKGMFPTPTKLAVDLGRGEATRQVARSGGRVKAAGIKTPDYPQSTAAAALVAAENLTRISSAEGKAATNVIKAIKRGASVEKVGKAYVEGAKQGFVENKSSWGDALREVGASRGAAAGLGFVMDVVLDPTTYLTLGIPSAGRAAARAAGEAAGRAAVKRGASEAVALREIKAAMRGEEAVVSPGASRMRGNIAGRMRERAASIESRGESPAIKQQRKQLRDLEQSGRGDSRKARNIRRNLERAGKRSESRVERASSRADKAERRAEDAASVVGPNGKLKIKPPRRSRLFASKGSQRARARNIIRPASTQARTKFGSMAERQVENSAKGQRTDRVLSVRFGSRRVADIPLEPFSKGAVKNSGELGIGAREFFGGVAPGIRADRGLPEKEFAGARQASRVERSGRGTAEVTSVLNMKAVERATGRIDDADKELWVAVYERSGDPATRVRVKDGSLVFGPDDALRGVPPRFAEKYLVKTRRRGFQLRGKKQVQDVIKGAERKVKQSGQPVGDALKIGLGRDSVKEGSATMQLTFDLEKTAVKKDSWGRKKGILTAKNSDGETVGLIRFEDRSLEAGDSLKPYADDFQGVIPTSEFTPAIRVELIRVEAPFRRQGVATALHEELVKRFPDSLIDYGEWTVAGKNWSIGANIPHTSLGGKPVEIKRQGRKMVGLEVGSRPKSKSTDGLGAEELASVYYPRRPAPDQKMPYEQRVDYLPPNMEPDSVGRAAAQQQGAKSVSGSVRGNLMGRKDPRPQDVGNAERLVSESASVRPKMGANPAQDVAAYGLNMERVAAYNNGVRRLAESGTPARMKPVGEETVDEFYRRNGIFPGQAESVGKKVYELGVRGEGAGRYDLREIEPEILEQLVTGKAPGGKPSKLTRNGQYVVLDERAVARFRQFRTAEVLGASVGTRIWDRLGGRLRQLAIFTPMYQAINEMGDTWIMYTVVPGYKVPYYKAKSLPVVRYLQAAEAGNKRVMREVGEAEIMVGGKYMKVKDVARIARAEGEARQGVFAKTVEVTNPEVRQVTKQASVVDPNAGPVRRAVASANNVRRRVANRAGDRLAKSDPALQMAATAPKRAAQSTGRFFRSREDWNRVATWLYFKDEGYTTDRAVQDSLEALIDYGELSHIERKYLRRLAFFYTFPARQIPYQTKALFRRPGKLAAYEKLRVAAADYQGIELSDLYKQPWYVQANVPIPLRIKGEVRWVSANLPFNMLNQSLPIGSNWPIWGKEGLIMRDAEFAFGSLNPLLRIPVEDYANRNFFFRSNIEEEGGMSANETAAPWYIVKLVKAVPSLQRQLGVYYKETRNSAGQKIWVMDKKWAWRFSQAAYGPVRVPSELGKFRNERGQSFTDQMIRFGTGFRFDRDKSLDERSTRIFDRLGEIQEQLNKMRGDSRFEGKARWRKLQAEQKKLKTEQKKLGKQMGLTWGYGEQRPSSKKKKSGGWAASDSGSSGGGWATGSSGGSSGGWAK